MSEETVMSEEEKLIDEIAHNEGFENYEVEIKSGSMKGDGYLGIIKTVKIQEKNNPKKVLHLILKSSMKNEKIREHMPIRKAYEREIFMYDTIFPQLKKFSQENNVRNEFRETAKFYKSILDEQEECLILENLKEKGFMLWNRKIPMDEAHVSLVFKTYGKYHGTSLALKKLNPAFFDEASNNLKHIFYSDDTSSEKLENLVSHSRGIFSNGLMAVKGDEKATNAVTNFMENQKSFFMNIRKIDKFSCILHGDCWTNNMMFQYKDINDPLRPTDICLLDWQIAHIGSPIIDLSYFFYAAGSDKNILNNLKMFLKIYYESLSTTVTEFGLNPDVVITYDEILEQWPIYSKYGFFMTLMVMKLLIGESDEAPDLVEITNSGKNLLETSTVMESVNSTAGLKRIRDVINFMVDNDYL